VLLHSFFYFILSILSNDQNVVKPVYWAGVVETDTELSVQVNSSKEIESSESYYSDE
jgi:hypothetical protein